MNWQSQRGVAFVPFYPNKCVVSFFFFKGFCCFLFILGFCTNWGRQPIAMETVLLLKSIKTLIE